MREILFRGRDIAGNWHYGDLEIISDDLCKIVNHKLLEYGKVVDRDTVGQCTGLTDKNGTKIFENGYLIIDKQTYKVAFNNGEYISTNIFGCDIIQLKNNSSIGVFVDEI